VNTAAVVLITHSPEQKHRLLWDHVTMSLSFCFTLNFCDVKIAIQELELNLNILELEFPSVKHRKREGGAEFLGNISADFSLSAT
jgi:hypothetical protein